MNLPPKQITVKISTIRGKSVIIPLCPKSLLLAQLGGIKTFSKQNIDLIKELGYNIKVKQEIKTINSIF